MEKPRYDYARQMARKVLKDCEIVQPPVDLQLLLKKKGYDYVEVDNFPKEVDALCIEAGNVCYFAVNSHHHLHRKRFSVAHEFGHVLLKHNICYYNFDISIDNPPEAKYHNASEESFEKEANAFAGELLVPLEMLKVEFKKTQDIGALSKIFLVSQQAMGVAISNNMRSLFK